MRSLEKIRMLNGFDKTEGRRPKVCCQPYVAIKEKHYTITFDFASYDDLPSLDDVIDIVNDGLRDDFPNCTINVRECKTIHPESSDKGSNNNTKRKKLSK